MNFALKDWINRKLITTFILTTVISSIMSFAYLRGWGELPIQGTFFLGWFAVYAMYVGVVILLYGNIVSLLIEYFHIKRCFLPSWLYILLHGIFGLANGLIFHEVNAGVNVVLLFYSCMAALFYGLIDRWIYIRTEAGKSLSLPIAVPMVVFVSCYLYFLLGHYYFLLYIR
ncbi:MAG: hypothetical protein ABF649_19295 [Bacillus sp. (in: firmicutes)]